MENIKDILNSIKRHTDAEADKGAQNRSIGRSLVKIGMQGTKNVWLTNTKVQPNYDHYVDNCGMVHGVAHSSIHTYTEDGPTVFKNSELGQILMYNCSGIHPYMTPGGKMNAEIFNSSYYIQSQSDGSVNNLNINIAGNPKALSFQTLA